MHRKLLMESKHGINTARNIILQKVKESDIKDIVLRKAKEFFYDYSSLSLTLSWVFPDEGSVGRSLLFSLGLATQIKLLQCSLFKIIVCLCKTVRVLQTARVHYLNELLTP